MNMFVNFFENKELGLSEIVEKGKRNSSKR